MHTHERVVSVHRRHREPIVIYSREQDAAPQWRRRTRIARAIHPSSPRLPFAASGSQSLDLEASLLPGPRWNRVKVKVPKRLPLDSPIKLTDTITYLISSYHRRGRKKGKSTWVVSRRHEVACFISSQQSDWCEGHNGWGLRTGDDGLVRLGTTARGQDTKIAKFVSGDSAPWHGFPADMARLHDLPPLAVLREWVDQGLIRKHQMRKIARAIPCGL